MQNIYVCNTSFLERVYYFAIYCCQVFVRDILLLYNHFFNIFYFSQPLLKQQKIVKKNENGRKKTIRYFWWDWILSNEHTHAEAILLWDVTFYFHFLCVTHALQMRLLHNIYSAMLWLRLPLLHTFSHFFSFSYVCRLR